MTNTPFDDHDAFFRRWGHPDPAHWRQLADADPLLFLADHIPSNDRREGAIALCITVVDGPGTMALIPDGPTQPSDHDCLRLLDHAAASTDGGILSMGVVHHRRGSPAVSDSDRRWALALKAISLAYGFDTLGVLARLYGGEIIRVDVPTVLPADYLNAISQ